jgi:PAS domain S-box-containing protein
MATTKKNQFHDENRQLMQQISKLETEVKHLRNEMKLLEKEKEAARRNYFDMVANMEEKVEQRTRETRELKRLSDARGNELQLILDSSPSMIFFKDTEQRYVRVNQAFARNIGRPIREIVGKTFQELFPNCPSSLLQNDLDVLKSGEPVFNIATRMKFRDSIRHVLINKIPYKDIDDRIVGIIGFALDITQLKQAEKEKQDLELRLNQLEKMEAIGRLAGGVAHDLNNVLSAVVSYPDLLLMRLPQDSPIKKPILTMQKSGQKAAAIVEDLLTLARRGVSVTEVLNLNEIVKNYLVSPEFETLKVYNSLVNIEFELEPDLLNIKGSPIHLTQTVMNLISNAAEATLRKGTVIISTYNCYLDKPVESYDLSIEPGEYVVLRVEDNGVGIRSEDLKKIFEPFYTKKVMGRSGTGLGMAVVWGTVKDHKGNIKVTSQEGKGTIFELYFPVTRQQIPKSESSISIKEYSGNKEKLLVVDDVQDQREISSTLLTSLNYDVITVSSGEDAVEYLKNEKVELVILDMIMDPGMDGLDTYKNILEQYPLQKAIITSGYSETKRVKEAQQLGVGMYIKKPYTLEKIGMAVRTELDRKL